MYLPGYNDILILPIKHNRIQKANASINEVKNSVIKEINSFFRQNFTNNLSGGLIINRNAIALPKFL